MDLQKLEQITSQAVDEMPAKILRYLEGVEFLVCQNAEEATANCNEEFEEPLDEPIAADAKGVFVGEPMEVEDDEDGQVMELAEGFIVLIADNIADAEEASIVLMHEIGHALGLDEEGVKALGLSGEGEESHAGTAPEVPKPRDVV